VNIYQAIWDAEMKENGIPPMFTAENKDISQGYVLVDRQNEHQLLKDLHIPDRKRHSYQLVEKLFDNFTLNKKSEEKYATEKEKEVQQFLRMAIQSSPMKIAKNFVEEVMDQKFTDSQWYNYLHDLWFRQFDDKHGKDLSGFEHVFIGEQKGKELEGHHFWYKYWLEENGDLNEQHINQIDAIDTANDKEESPASVVITVSYHLKAIDYEKQRFIKLKKRKSTFFVGTSAEGLLALGTVRALPEKCVPLNCVINDTHYKLECFMSPDGKSIRSFYPSYIPFN
jgi:poly(U)-specific endoribonuclease